MEPVVLRSRGDLMGGIVPHSERYEDSTAVKHQHRDPPEKNGREREQKRAPKRPRPGREGILVEEQVEACERAVRSLDLVQDEALRHEPREREDRDRVSSEDQGGIGPAPPLLHVHDPVEKAEELESGAGGEENVGARPEVLVDGKPDAPEKAREDERPTRGKQSRGLLVAVLAFLNGLIRAQTLTGEIAEKRRRDRRKRAEEPLRIPRRFPQVASEKKAIYPCREVSLDGEIAPEKKKVSQKEEGEGPVKRFSARVEHEKRCRQIADRDPLQNARDAEMSQIE